MMHFFVFLFVTQYFKVFHNVTLLLTDVFFFFLRKKMFIQDKQFPGYTSFLMVLVNSSYSHVLQFKLAYWLFNISPCLRLSGSDKCLKLVLLIIHSANIIKYQLGIWHTLIVNVKAEIYPPPPIKKRIKQNITKQ